jgi:LAO/AO transport system kinase
MDKLSVQDHAFIRPSPSKGSLGGVAGKTREAVIICEAAGFDVIIVETVGVGQSETTVASMVDFFLLLMLAGAGDEFQGIKKGILEIADAIVVNKADGDNLEKARQAQKMFEAVLHLFTPASATWSPHVLISSAVEKRGFDEIWQTVLEHREKLLRTGELEARRRKQSLDWMWALVNEGIKARFDQNRQIRKLLFDLTRHIEEGTITPTSAAQKILSLLDK